VSVQFSFIPPTQGVEFVRQLVHAAQQAGQFTGVIPISCPREVYRLLSDSGAPVVVLGSLYPDHVVFLGPGIVIAEAGENAADAARRSGRAAPPLVVVPGAGVLQHNAATPGARALIRCLADVTCRLKSDDPIAPLSPEDEAQLLNWDAEKYRQWLDARAP